MIRFLFAFIITLWGSTLNLHAFYDSQSGHSYTIICNSPSDGYTVEFAESIRMDVSIPEQILYNGHQYTVVGIGKSAFSNKTIDGEKLQLPKTLRYIEDEAFRNCIFQNKNYLTLQLPDNISRIGTQAFAGVSTNLSGMSLVLPSGLSQIPRSAFLASAINHVSIPPAVKVIGDYAFEDFSGSVSGASGLENIGSYAFYRASKITNLNFNNVKSIGSSAFCNTPLTKVVLPTSMTDLGSEVFKSCKSLQSVEFKGQLSRIPLNSFADCVKLSTVILPDNLAEIGDYAFKNCVKLSSIVLPDSLTFIGRGAFEKAGIERIEFPSSLKRLSISSFENTTSLREIIFKEGISTLPQNSFRNSPVSKLVIPTTLKTIVDGAIDFSNIKLLVCKASIPPTTFNKQVEQMKQPYVLVPYGSKYSYKTTEAWWSISNDNYIQMPTWCASFDECNLHYGDCIPVVKFEFYAGDSLSGDYLKDNVTFEDLTEGDKGIPGTTESGEQLRSTGLHRLEVHWDKEPRSNYVALGGMSFDVLKRPITVTAQNAEKLYGDANPTFACSFENVVHGDETLLASQAVFTCSADEHTPANVECEITVMEPDNDKYDFVYKGGKLTVKPAPLEISAPELNREYMKENPEVELTYSGFKLNESPDVLEQKPIISIDAHIDSAPGEYPINISGACSNNYDITHTPGKLIISKAHQSILWTQTIPENITEGDFLTLDASASSGLPVIYESNNSDVAVINDNKVEFIGAGKVLISATQQGDMNYLAAQPVEKQFEVRPIKVESISIEPAALSMSVGETRQLTATVSPENASDKTISWQSINPAIATISTQGLVTALAEGKTTIIATGMDGSSVIAKCDVAVSLQSSISDINSDSFKINIIGHTLVIEGNQSEVHILTVDGNCIYSGFNNRIELQPGIYIIVIDQTVQKIII